MKFDPVVPILLFIGGILVSCLSIGLIVFGQYIASLF